jgi:predicted phage-related endonuclease
MDVEIKVERPKNKVVNEKIEAYLALKKQIAELTKQLDTQKEELRSYVTSSNNKLYVDEHSITVKICTRSTVDTKALQAAHPKLAEKFMRNTTYETVVIK